MLYHVTPSYPPQLGGLEKVVQVLAGTQASNGLEVAVITAAHGSQPGTINEKFPVTRLRSFAFASTTFMFGLPFTLLRIRRSDVVHLHITQAYTPEMVWLAARIKRFKYIAHIHIDAPAAGWAGFLLRVYKPLVLARVLRSAKYVVVFTEDQKQAVHAKYKVSLDNIQVIPNGVEQKFYTDKKRSMHKLPRLLFVGRLGFQKDIPLLLHALDGISDTFQTTLVGSGDSRDSLESLANELSLKNVTFAGRAEGDKLLQFYDAADIFVLSSEREGMPLVLLEAMAMGLPIVATDVTGTHDVVENEKNGLLVPHGDATAFRSALLRVAADKELYDRLQKHAKAMSRQYSWTVVAKQFVDLYNN